MTTNFPSGLDAFTNPSATDAMDSVTVPHASQHADLNDAVEALQAKVGVDGSAVTTSLDYKLSNLLGNVTALYDTTSQNTNGYTFMYASFGAGTELCDPSNWHSTTTNPSRITPDVAGTYLVTGTGNLETTSFSSSARFYLSIQKNGSNYQEVNMWANKYPSASIATVVNMNGTTDYLELVLFQDTTTTIPSIRRTFSCMLLRAT